MRILALVPGGIGDQILFFPTLEDLKRSYPNAKIDIIAEPRSKAAYRVNKYFHDKSLNVVNFDFKDRNGLADWGNLLGIMRDVEYDAVLSLGQIPTLGLLLWLTGIPKRVGYNTAASWFLTNSLPLKTDQYKAETYHDLLQGFGITTACPNLSVTLLKEDIAWAEREQQRLGIKNSGYILLHSGVTQVTKTNGIDQIYPVNNWQKIIQDIQKRQPQLPVVAIKGPEDEELVSELLQACPGLKLTSPENVGELAAMIAGANLMICTPGTPMHLAVAVQTYTIALLGPSEPKQLLPNSDKYIGIQSNTAAMADISPETVIKKIWGES
ncbi:glycosyltransferase family 9 protein [Ancylothrix sp. C2]|uniref:glycosyltransferase family 9 protein n=1 Tax=Ancylothrix sp. D3o TaxID=2953691 RepID=UPI0021BA7B0A|nr:glycosyltransferase family 9 protein [Ancylothrix sp. D3o]MCT7952329.1 glycosyltransferase family 9 protein [Ancylothrix sp. D3o]